MMGLEEKGQAVVRIQYRKIDRSGVISHTAFALDDIHIKLLLLLLLRPSIDLFVAKLQTELLSIAMKFDLGLRIDSARSLCLLY